MINLNQIRCERENKDYFRAVRNDLSRSKRALSYSSMLAIAGVGGGLIMLIPAIGPIVAAPTMATLIGVSSNVVGAAALTGISAGAHFSALRKDNALAKAERSIKGASKIEVKLQKKENISDRQYAKLAAKRDKKLEYFDKVYRMYERKTNRLARLMGEKYDVETKEHIVTDEKKQDSLLYNRRAKKFHKVSTKYDELYKDWKDYNKIRSGEATEEFLANLHYNSVPQKAKRGAVAVGSATKQGALKTGHAAKVGGVYVANAGIHAGHALKKTYGVSKKAYSKTASVLGREGGKAKFKMEKALAKEKNRKLAVERAVQAGMKLGLSEKKARKMAEESVFVPGYGIVGRNDILTNRMKDKTKSGAIKVGDSAKLGGVYVANAGIYTGRALKRYYNVAKDRLSQKEVTIDDSPYWTEGGDYTVPPYQASKLDDMSLFDQLCNTANLYGKVNENNELFRFDEKTKSYETLQPRVIKNPLITKEKYFANLQNESINSHPYAVSKKADLESYVNFYETTKYSNQMNDIASDVVDFRDAYDKTRNYVAENSIKVPNNQNIVVQLDLDEPNFTEFKTFDNVQDALVYTRFAQKLGANAYEDSKCNGFRITTWQQEPNGAYSPVVPFCTKVSSDAELEQSNEQMRNSFLREIKTLQRNAYMMNRETSKTSTIELIQSIESMSGNEKLSKEQVEQLYKNLPTFDLNTLVGDEKAIDSEDFSKLDQEFYARQFVKSKVVSIDVNK